MKGARNSFLFLKVKISDKTVPLSVEGFWQSHCTYFNVFGAKKTRIETDKIT